MPWREVTVLSERMEFVKFAMQPTCHFSQLCERFGISRKTGYKWVERFGQHGEQGVSNRSRRPLRSPARTAQAMETAILEVREIAPVWGGRKIKRVLQDQGYQRVPAPSTITAILHRHAKIQPQESPKHAAFVRFERSAPNELWQMDFKGHVACPEGRCHPFTILDDCSRYAVALQACSNEKGSTVKQHLSEVFGRYGLPQQILLDNGSPWGDDASDPLTQLGVWLIRLGIGVSHSRPYHPQTLGKEERFHRTLKAELLGDYIAWTQEECQRRMDRWRYRYNHQRPHEALQMQVPASRYQPSARSFSERLAEIEYGAQDQVRRVQKGGYISYRGIEYKLSKALCGQRVALRPRPQEDGGMEVYFCQQKVGEISLRNH